MRFFCTFGLILCIVIIISIIIIAMIVFEKSLFWINIQKFVDLICKLRFNFISKFRLKFIFFIWLLMYYQCLCINCIYKLYTFICELSS